MKKKYLQLIYWKPFPYVLDCWESINEPEIYIVCFNPAMNVPNFFNMWSDFKPPLSSIERDWAPTVADQRQGAQQNHGETTEEGNCSYLLPLSHRENDAELCRSVVSPPWGVTKRTQLDRQANMCCARRRLTAVPVRLQLSTTDDARTRFYDGQIFHRRSTAKVLNIQNFRTTTARYWRPVALAFTHGCVCALWRSTAFIYGF